VKNSGNIVIWGAWAVFGAGLMASGCKSAPPLSQDSALQMIQAKYDQSQPTASDIVVTDLGMREGVTAKYWEGVKKYPNGFWADFKLTPEGKKLVKLANGTDTINWRPPGPNDPHYAVVVTTLGTQRLKAHDIVEIQDVGDSKVAVYTEDVDLSGIPDPLRGIAQNPGNQLSTRRHATFVLTNGAWALESIE
jgi:hypothetical protein